MTLASLMDPSPTHSYPSADSFGEGFDLFWREDGVGIRGDAEHGDVTVGERVDVVDDRFLHFQWVFLEFIFAEDGDFGRAFGFGEEGSPAFARRIRRGGE